MSFRSKVLNIYSNMGRDCSTITYKDMFGTNRKIMGLNQLESSNPGAHVINAEFAKRHVFNRWLQTLGRCAPKNNPYHGHRFAQNFVRHLKFSVVPDSISGDATLRIRSGVHNGSIGSLKAAWYLLQYWTEGKIELVRDTQHGVFHTVKFTFDPNNRNSRAQTALDGTWLRYIAPWPLTEEKSEPVAAPVNIIQPDSELMAARDELNGSLDKMISILESRLSQAQAAHQAIARSFTKSADRLSQLTLRIDALKKVRS